MDRRGFGQRSGNAANGEGNGREIQEGGQSQGGLMRVFKCPRFLFDLAEELHWLNEKAGPHVATAWYESLKATIHQLLGIES